MKNKQVMQFIRSVEKKLPCSKAEKKSILLHLENSVLEYTEEHPEVSLEELQHRFGTPETIANEYTALLEPDVLCDATRTVKRTRKILVICVAVLVLAIILSVVGIIFWNAFSKPTIIYETIV